MHVLIWRDLLLMSKPDSPGGYSYIITCILSEDLFIVLVVFDSFDLLFYV